jgi:protein O-mannosyl-transferase
MNKKSDFSPKGVKGRPINRPSNSSSYIVPFLILAYSFILYGNTLSHSYALDDDFVSKGNSFVKQGFQGIPAIFSRGFFYGFNQRNDQAYRPIPLLTTAVEVGFWGENPQTHHFFNVFYYALACLLLFFVLKRIFSQYPVIIPFLIVLVFTAHPVHTEDVANIKSRDEILNFLFLQGLLLTLFRFIDTNKKGFLGLSLLFFFLATLTKEGAITFLGLIPLFIYFFSTVSWKRILTILIPFVAVAGLYFVLRLSVLDAVTFKEKLTLINNSLLSAVNPYDRLATAILVQGKYLLLLFFPHPLSYDYSYNQIPVVTFFNPWVLLTLLVFIALTVYAILGI